jgi:hypothetical protein
MELKRNREIRIKAWYNQSELVTDSDKWEVFSKDEEDTLYIFVKDSLNGNQLKLKIEKSAEIKEESSKSEETEKKQEESE